MLYKANSGNVNQGNTFHLDKTSVLNKSRGEEIFVFGSSIGKNPGTFVLVWVGVQRSKKSRIGVTPATC